VNRAVNVNYKIGIR